MKAWSAAGDQPFAQGRHHVEAKGQKVRRPLFVAVQALVEPAGISAPQAREKRRSPVLLVMGMIPGMMGVVTPRADTRSQKSK